MSGSLPVAGSMGCWLLAVRPRTLFAAFVPVIIGWTLAWSAGGFHWPAACGALLAALLIQIGTNLANDYWDWRKGTDRTERLGPVRVTSAGLLPPSRVLGATLVVFATACLIGAALVWRGGWPILLIGVLAVLFGFLYTAGPFPLAYIGLGEVFVVVFFGPVAVAGTYYVQALEWSSAAVIAGLAPGFHSAGLLVVNNLRDRRGDALHDKKTLAVRFGARFARLEYLVCLAVPLLVPPVLVAGGWAPPGFWLVSLVAAVPSFLLARGFSRMPEGAGLNAYLGKTGRLANGFALLFIAGWILLPR